MIFLLTLIIGFGIGYEATSKDAPVQKERQLKQHAKECPLIPKGGN